MEIKTVTRRIHPDSHKSESPYRVKIGKCNFYDQLIVDIFHDKLGFIGTYQFSKESIKDYESIHFKAIEKGEVVQIKWVQDIEFTKIK